MLVRVDLGLPYLVVLVVVVVVLPAIGFVIRRKWRRAVARREEIKRLLVLASEEAARAEVEATEGYYYTAAATVSAPFPVSASVPAPVTVPLVSSVKPPYQCAVCFSPTTTRCAKCKAVRYCSGRCQIVHWRQGHKDECRPYVAVDPIKDVAGSSYKQGDGKDYNESFGAEGQPTITPVERLREDLHHKDDAGVESRAHPQETKTTFQSADSSCEEYSAFSTPSKSSFEASSGSSRESDRVDIHQFAAHVTSENSEKVKSVRQTLVSPARNSTGLGKVNQHKSNLSDEDARSRSSSSSSQTDDGSNESSFSEPSSTSSGFWSGTFHSKKSSIDEFDDFEPSSSSEAANGNVNDSRPPLRSSFDATKSGFNSTIANGFTSTSTIFDKSAPTGLRSKKSNDETTPSKEMSNDGLNSRRPPKCTSEMLKHRDVDAGSDLLKSKIKETKLSPSGDAFHRPAAAGGHSAPKDAKAFGGMPSASPDRSNHVLNNKDIDSPTLKSIGIGSSLSKAPDTHLTSSTSRHASQSTKPVKVNDKNHRVATSSSQLTESSQSGARNGLKTSVLKAVDQLMPSKLSRHGSLEGESETAHRYNCKGLFSYEMFVKLYNWKKVEMQPCGLINCGNSCYANAVLQCLAYTPPLTAYLLKGIHSKACNKREWCFTCEFEGVVQKAKDGNSPLSPIRILSQIKNIGSNLGHGRQEDAHEFLRYAIDTLQSVCLKEAGTNASNSFEEETTLIGLTFGGYLRSKIKCMKCGGKSERDERMMDLTVEIQGDIGTLEEALDKFTCTEILDGENKYKCSRCKSYEKARKKLTLLEAPNVLTIALKRFQSGKFGKLNKSIRFPEILDMAPYVSGTSDKSPVYRLYGVVVHLDVMNAAFSGHYVCYVKNVQERWFKIDDSMVKEVDLHSVLTKGAYMLLYARCSPRAPRAIRSSLMHHHDPRNHKAPTSFKSLSNSTEPWADPTSQPPIRHRSLEEESSSSSDNSGFFSESCSCSTASSHRDSSSIEDHVFGDWERDCWNMKLNSSDSDTSSSSSFPSPLYGGRSQDNHETASREQSKAGSGVLYCDDPSIVDCRSSSCRETNFDSLGGRTIDPSGNSKPVVTFRRSTTRVRSD